ncbi:NADH-quinone oxidoreductase subunit A [Actinomadura keratinilytica]
MRKDGPCSCCSPSACSASCSCTAPTALRGTSRTRPGPAAVQRRTRPAEHPASRFHVRWYPVSLVFLAFDMEMLFMYPWVRVVGEMGTPAVVEMFLFLGILLAAVAYAWREGAFRWS